jgi:hypothetical protein
LKKEVKMKIYLYVEHHPLSGQVATLDVEDCEDNSDVFLAVDGERDDAIQDALLSLGTRYDKRPGGAGDSFRWKCDRAVVKALDGPFVEYDEQLRAYRVIRDEESEISN